MITAERSLPAVDRTERPAPFATAATMAAEGEVRIGLLTGGIDRHYAVGLASALAAQGVGIDFIGSDELDGPDVRRVHGLRFLNLRRDQREDAGMLRKALRIASYYARLVRYVAIARPPLLHLLWNNKFEVFDRTILMLYYRWLGCRVTMTAHNVNAARRNAQDSWLNRASLRVQYHLCHHIFVHTERMKRDLTAEFGVAGAKITIIPYGINDAVPAGDLTRDQARALLGLSEGERTLLFFGQIAPYKGLKYLISAIAELADAGEPVKLIIAGKIKKGYDNYWDEVRRDIDARAISDRVLARIRFIPDEEIEQYFVATDAVVLPYVSIFQSGILFLALGFGVPVIATDVGSLRQDVVDGQTGFICRPEDSSGLAQTIRRYFSSELYRDRDANRSRIRDLARERHSWTTVGAISKTVYAGLLAHH